jgi:hypothetical protein
MSVVDQVSKEESILLAVVPSYIIKHLDIFRKEVLEGKAE